MLFFFTHCSSSFGCSEQISLSSSQEGEQKGYPSPLCRRGEFKLTMKRLQLEMEGERVKVEKQQLNMEKEGKPPNFHPPPTKKD